MSDRSIAGTVGGKGKISSRKLKQLTETAQKFLESPPMQLQAIAAMRRETGKGQKPPRGIRAGLGLTGAVRSAFGGVSEEPGEDGASNSAPSPPADEERRI